MKTYPVVDWAGLYGEGWGEDIVPEAFSHPAKYSRALIRHIYQYLIDNGMLKRGDRVLDCFGGVALGALDAQLQGLHYTGIELEEKFVLLGNQNIDLWNRKYRPHFPRFGTAVLLQGDSRRIGAVVRGAGGIVSSPPYSDALNRKSDEPDYSGEGGPNHPRMYGESEGQLGAMASGDVNAILSSPPYAEARIGGTDTMGRSSDAEGDYGESEGQLGAMPSGDFGALLSSPPYEHDTISRDQRPDNPTYADRDYGQTEGQLGGMSPGDFGGVIASPPFVDALGNKPSEGLLAGSGGRMGASQKNDDYYGESDGQLGSMPPGDVNAIIASPPFGSHDSAGPESLHTRTDESAKAMLGAQGWNGGGQVSEDNLATLPEDDFDAVISSPPFGEAQSGGGLYKNPTEKMGKMSRGGGYGVEEHGMESGQLGNMPTDDYAAVISSPPFIQTSGGTNVTSPEGPLADASLISRHSAGNAAMHGYGESEGNIQAMPEGDYNAVVGSPPYDPGQHSGSDTPSRSGLNADGMPRGGETRYQYGEAAGQMQAMKEGDIDAIIASPPFIGVEGSNSANKYADPEKTAEEMARKYEDGTFKGHKASKEAILKSLTRENEWNYGSTPGQLANAPEGRFESVVSSPPFTGVIGLDGGASKRPEDYGHIGDFGKEYGNTPGQLADSPSGDFESVVSSPPYEGSNDHERPLDSTRDKNNRHSISLPYGETKENIGNDSGDTFWSAALTIVTECYKLLAPGSVAVWICKDYVRAKKRVPFSDQWRMLCEKVGFTTLTEVHAWVVEDNGTQLGMLDTEDKHHKTERKSFFRRLAEKKGSPRIDWECVWIMRK